MSDKCCYCNNEIPLGACQQSQVIDGDFYPLHVGCADEWAKEEIEVWTIESEDYGYTSKKECVLAEIENLDFDQKITFEKRKMERFKFLTLPEANI